MKNLQSFEEFLNENLTNRILDKISEVGYENLSKSEKQFLANKSKGVNDDELEDILNIDSGYEFNGTVDVYDDYLEDKRVAEVKFIYDETEEWDEDPVEYKHTGELFVDDEEYYATMYADEDYNVNSFDLHDGDDYVEFDDELEESFLKFFQQVGNKIKQSII